MLRLRQRLTLDWLQQHKLDRHDSTYRLGSRRHRGRDQRRLRLMLASSWMVMTGPKSHATGFIEGVNLLASTRLCPNVPAQHGIQVALGGYQSIQDLILPGGRLKEQRDVAWKKLNEIPGVSCVKPMGALYAFPRLDPEVHEIHDDEQLMLDILREEKILMVGGSGFNYPHHDHFRIVTLPWARELETAIDRIGNFLAHYKQ